MALPQGTNARGKAVRVTDPPARRRRRDERGASLVEYALLVALIAIALITAVSTLGDGGSDSLDRSASRISVSH